MTTVFAFSHVAFLLALFLVGLTEFNDIAQYLWGKSFRRIKVTPTVSPNKTLAGLAGLALGPLLTPLNASMSLLAGGIMGITGFCGDVKLPPVETGGKNI